MGVEVAVQVFQGFDDRVEPVEDRLRGWGVSGGGHRVSLSSFELRAGRSRKSFERKLAEVGLGDLEDLVAPAGENAPGGPERESLGLLGCDLGWNRQLLTYGHDLDDRRTIVRERRPQRVVELARMLNPH